MRLKKAIVMSLLAMTLTMILVGSASALPPFPNLPSGPVTLTSDFFVTEDQFDVISVLSGVPKGYDVHDGAYTGHCADRRGPGEPTGDPVRLYSSLNVPDITPLELQDWNRINYVLNHEDPQATSRDVQEAIWSFVNFGGSFTSTRPIALAMVADAETNGENFVPTRGQTVAVICLPQGWDSEEKLQITIIELLLRFNGKVTGGGQCITESSSEIPAASFGFNAMWFSRRAAPQGELNYVDHTTGMHVHIHELTYLEVYEDEPGNKPWPLRIAIFGGPCTINGEGGFFADVYVEDHGEPGKDDQFKITLSNGYVGGSSTVPILAGNIQIHRPPK